MCQYSYALTMPSELYTGYSTYPHAARSHGEAAGAAQPPTLCHALTKKFSALLREIPILVQ